MKVLNCPKCGSTNIIKKGLYKNKNVKKQRYFQPKVYLPSWVKKAYNDYVFKNFILKDLSIKFRKSIKTITKYFDLLNNLETEQHIDDVNNKKRPLIQIPISLIFDATFFKRNK